jgi:hypothetical protein
MSNMERCLGFPPKSEVEINSLNFFRSLADKMDKIWLSLVIIFGTINIIIHYENQEHFIFYHLTFECV